MRDAGPKVRRLLHWLRLDRLSGAKGEATHSTQDDWVSPDTSNHWHITRVGDLSRFLCFVLSQSREGETWQMQLTCDESNPLWEKLRSISAEPETIVLTRETVPRLQELLLDDEDFSGWMCHLCISTGGGLLSVHSGAEVLLAGYDLWFDGTCWGGLLWLSKRIDLATMIRASRECDFDFE